MKKNIFTNQELHDNPYLQFFSYSYSKNRHTFRYHRNGVQLFCSDKSIDKVKIKVLEACEKLSQSNGKYIKAEHYITKYGRKWLDVSKKPFIHKDTYRVYDGAFRNYIEPYFKNKTFEQVDYFELQQFFNDLPQEKGKTIENIKIVLSGIYKLAYSQDIITKNIMELIAIKKHIRKKGKCLSQEDEFLFIQSIKGNNKELTYLVLLYSGVRPAELNSIDFDWKNNTMTIKNAKLKSWQTNYYRVVPIFPLLKALKDRLLTENWKLNTKTTSMKFHRFCPNYRQYDLRHTFITRAKTCGVPDEIVSLWTGHSSGKTITQEYYTHYSMETMQKEAKKVAYQLN